MIQWRLQNQMIQSKNTFEAYKMKKQTKITRNNYYLPICGSHKLTKLQAQNLGRKSNLKTKSFYLFSFKASKPFKGLSFVKKCKYLKEIGLLSLFP
jgi:hypothetical protein